MAEKLERELLVSERANLKDKINYISANVALVQTELELQEEILKLENAAKIKKSCDEMAAFLSNLEDISSTFQFIVAHRIDLRKRLYSPNVPNAIPVKYKQQENFVSCCQKLPSIIDFLGSIQRKEHVYDFLRSQQIASHMDKEFKSAKDYCDHIKYFLSSNEEFLKNMNAVCTLWHYGG